MKKDLPWDSQLKFALFAVRATPNKSTGYAPFEIIHGKVLRSPLDVVLNDIDPVQSHNVKAVEWLEEFSRRVTKIREEVQVNIGKAQQERKERHDQRAVVRKKVLTRVPGLKSKLEGSWEGPFVVLNVPSEYHVVLGTLGKACGKAQGKRVHITGEAPPVRSAPFQVPLKWEKAVEAEIRLLKDKGILVPSSSPWGSPMVPVAKKDGGVRICIDFRKINKLTVKDPYHIPLV